jgi:ATP-dependent RNA helicase DeaD
MNRKAAKLNMVSKVVLDEADEMLNMGFTEDLNTILAGVPESRNTLLFSATMPQEISAIAKNYMRNPIEVTIGKKNTGAENIKHICYTVHAKDKYLVLKRIADYNPNIFGLVFCRTRKETQEVADKLMHDGYNADALHGDLSQSQRDFVMHRFRLRQLNLLVATDVAARGIDVDDLTHVINYNLPDDYEIYTHRSGRTGRAGKTGVSVAIVNLKERYVIRQIEKLINKQFVFQNVPTGREICEKQLYSLMDKLERVEVDQLEIEPYLPFILRKLEWLDKEELLKRLVSLEFNRFLEYYKKTKDIDVPVEQSRSEFPRETSRNKYGDKRDRGTRERGSRDHESESGYKRLFINLGKIDGLYPNNLIELINQCNTGKRIKIGKIEMMKSFAFFEVPDRDAPFVLESMKKAKYEGRRVAVDLASKPE